MKKRLLSALLALVMVLALLPVSVFAEQAAAEDGETQADAGQIEENPGVQDVTEDGEDEEIVNPPLQLQAARSFVAADFNKGPATYETRYSSAWGAEVDYSDLPGWVVRTKDKGPDNQYHYGVANTGYIAGGTYYANIADVPSYKADGNVINNIAVINASGTINIPTTTNTITVELYGADTNVAIVAPANVTSLTLKNSKGGTNPKISSITLPNRKFTTLTLNGVDVTGGISLTGSSGANANRTISLTNAAIGAIELVGVSSETVGTRTTTYDCSQKVTATNSTIASITLTGKNSSVDLTGCFVGSDRTDTSTVGDITVTSTGGSVKVGGRSDVGDIVVKSQADKAVAANIPSVAISNSTTVTSIKGGSGELSTSNAVVTISDVAQVGTPGTDAIVFPRAAITVSGGTVGDVKLTDNANSTALTAAGSLNITGTYVTVGDVTLNGRTSLTVKDSYNENSAESATNGAHNSVGSIIVSGANVTLTIPKDPTNIYGGANSNLADYVAHGIQGGTWRHIVPEKALNESLVYYLLDDWRKVATNAATYTYFNADQLGAALNRQYSAFTTSAGSGCRLRVKGHVYGSAGYGDVYFMNGATVWGIMQVSDRVDIKLPSMVNNVKISSWFDGSTTYPVTNNSNYRTPTLDNMKADDGAHGGRSWVELNASGGINTGDATKLTGVSASAAGVVEGSVRATLNGNVITLTGAVPSSGVPAITLTLITDAVEKVAIDPDDLTKGYYDRPVTLNVDVTYSSSSKVLLFDNKLSESNQIGKGMTLQSDASGLAILRLSNGTTYTLNGSGLKLRSDLIQVAKFDRGATYPDSDYSFIEVTVSDSTLRTPQDKQVVIDLLSKDGEAMFAWANSSAFKQAINAKLAEITDSQVKSWIEAAQRAAWGKINKDAYKAENGPSTGFGTAANSVWLVPYLQINVSRYQENGNLIATLVPSWRVEVRNDTAGHTYADVFDDVNNPNLPKNAYIAASGALSALTGNMGLSENDLANGVTLKFSNSLPAEFANAVMHQDATYAYKPASSVYTITHAGKSGLGSIVLNSTEPLVTLYENNRTTKVAYYDSLQAAVDDTKDGQHINVDQAYKGSTSVTVTGYARKFTIQANGNNVVLANASGGLVDLNSYGGEYTVQLSRDSTAVVDATTATIAVNTVLNGSATVSATTAKAGTAVTVTCAPAVGYRTNNVSVSAHMTATNTNSVVSVTRVSDNVYSFKVPQGADKITVTPNFVLGTVSAIPFTDVATNHWAYNSVKYVYDNGLMNGVNTAGTQFGGTQTLNRAMVVTILYRAAGSPYVGTASRFSDVANNTWYSQAVAWANQNNIVTGYTNGTFQPNWAITRQELATILYRYNTTYKGRATTGSTTLANFPDQGNVSDWATAGMQWAVGNGIVNGITNGYSTTLSPSGSATRYEAATMLMRYGQGMGL